MDILITGGCGFLGARLARALLAQGQLVLAGAAPQAIERIWLADRAPAPADLAQDARVALLQGDLRAQIAAGVLPLARVRLVYHLAAAVSGECEADYDLGMHSNLDATRELLDACRAAGQAPVFVFSSSVAVFGSAPGQPLPAVVQDDSLPTPQNSYGTQKFIGEQLVADCTRKGFVQGRSVRLMTVSVRPGQPNAAASSFLSAIVREPLAGLRAVCPVAPETPVALASPASTVRGLLRAASASSAEWGPRSAVNLPSVSTTVGAMVQALERVAGPAASARIDWQPDARVAAIVGSWPSRFAAARAAGLGLVADEGVEAIVRAYAAENPQAVQLPIRD